MSATFTKLNSGAWGIRVQGNATAGQAITVTKKDGTTQSVSISKVIWTDGKVCLCAITTTSSSNGSRSGSYATIGQRQATRQERTGWTGCSCGSIEGRPRASDCASCRHDY